MARTRTGPAPRDGSRKVHKPQAVRAASRGVILEEQICRIEVLREEDSYVVRVTSALDGTKEFRHPNLETLLRDVSMDLQLSYAEFVERDEKEYVDPEDLEEFREEEY